MIQYWYSCYADLFFLVSSIIFGRGEPTRKHPGNVILRGHVNKWLDEYMKGSKMNKSSIIRRVIQDIDESGARYLVPLDPSCRHTIFTAGCREARKSEVRSKVSHAFRDGERRIMLQREKEEKHVDTTGTFTRDRMGIPSETYLSQTTPSGKVTNLQRASSTHAAIENIDKADNSDSIHSPLPKLINAEKPKVEMHHQIDGQEDVSIPLPTPLYSNDTSIPSSEPITPSTDLLSFANILTSLRSNSSPEAPIVDPHDRLQALTTFAASSLSAISHKEKNPKKVKTSRKENLRYASPIVQSLEKYCRKSDIVFGRGAPLRQHPGNIKFRKIVSKYNKRYGEASKHEKTTIIQNVIRELQNTGAKFLIMDESSGVTEASSDDIRMKVSHRFRDFTKEKSSHGRPTTQNNANKSTEEVTTSTNHGAESLMIQV